MGQFIYNMKFILTFKICVSRSIHMYNKYTSRSPKKVDIIHEYLEKEISKILPENFTIKREQSINSLNFAKKKKCDIVIYKNNKPVIIVPVKFIMRNYKQNRNNYIENLIGEIWCLKKRNKGLKIIPFTIFIKKTPYFKTGNEFLKYEPEITTEELNHDVYDIFDDYVNILIDAGYLEEDKKKTTLIFNGIIKSKNIFIIIQEFLKEL